MVKFKKKKGGKKERGTSCGDGDCCCSSSLAELRGGGGKRWGKGGGVQSVCRPGCANERGGLDSKGKKKKNERDTVKVPPVDGRIGEIDRQRIVGREKNGSGCRAADVSVAI